MKGGSPSVMIRKMRIKTKRRRLTVGHDQENANQNQKEIPSHQSEQPVLRSLGEKRTPVRGWWARKLGQPLREPAGRFFQEQARCGSSPSTPRSSLVQIRSGTHAHPYVHCGFTTAEIRKQHKGPSLDERREEYVYNTGLLDSKKHACHLEQN